MLSIRIDPVLAKRLRTLANKTGRTQTFYAQKALEEKITEYEETFAPVIETSKKDPLAVKKAIAQLKELRKRITKPDGMSLKEMIEEGRM